VTYAGETLRGRRVLSGYKKGPKRQIYSCVSGDYDSIADMVKAEPRPCCCSKIIQFRYLGSVTPQAVAVNPVTNKVYVANGGGVNVTVIDGATNTTTPVSTGGFPVAVAVNSATNKIYVANSASANATVIDGATNTSVNVSTGATPNAVAVNSVTNKIYVANSGAATVTVIDGATNATTPVVAGSKPFSIAVNPVTTKSTLRTMTAPM
jgi:YVTN family beta-propeller protein